MEDADVTSMTAGQGPRHDAYSVTGNAFWCYFPPSLACGGAFEEYPMQISSSLNSSGASSLYTMDEMDSRLSADILSAKDADSSGALSASELGVSSEQIAQFDTDGDGVLSGSELTAALAAQREKMQAQMESEMQQSGQLGMLQASMSQSGSASGTESKPSLDDMVAGLFGGASGSTAGATDSDGSTETATASAVTASASLASNSGSILESYLEELDEKLANSLLNLKDANGDGVVSAEEMGVTAAQLAELDADGDGVLSESELSAGLKAQREEMLAESGGVMPPPPPPDAGDSEAAGVSSGSATSSLDVDAMIRGMFSSSTGTSTDSAGIADGTSDTVTASALSEFLLRQRASNAYQSVDGLISQLFGDSSVVSQSVSVDA